MQRVNENRVLRIAERQTALILDRYIRGPEGFGAERLASLTGVGESTIQAHCADERTPTAAHLLAYVSAIGSEEPARALALWRDLSAIVGMDARPQPHTVPADSVLVGSLELQAETGDVSRVLAKVTSPESPGGREIVASEVAEVIPEVRDVITAGCSLEAAALGVPTPQRAFALEER
jgi:hypothetical protein